MATKIVKTRLVIRNDKSTVWSSKNPILLKGELGIEEDTRKFKIGDGVSNWNSLLYANITDLSNYYTKSAIDEIVKNLATVEYVDNKVVTEIEKITQGGKVATLGEDGKIPASQLPSYVDDVVELYQGSSKYYVADFTPAPIPTGPISKIYFNVFFTQWAGTLSDEDSYRLLIDDLLKNNGESLTLCTFSSNYTIKCTREKESSSTKVYRLSLYDAEKHIQETYFYQRINNSTIPHDEYDLPEGIGEVVSVYIPNDEELKRKLYHCISSSPFNYVENIPESGKIYINLKNRRIYRWSGSSYIEISSSLALGYTSSTAFSGLEGKNLKDRVDVIEPLVNTNKTDISNLKSSVSTNTTNINNNTTEINSLKTSVKNVESRVAVNEENISQLESDVFKNTTDIEDLKSQIESGGTGGGSSDFIDVEELPEIIIDLPVTPYPIGENVYIDKIYFNTALSIDEVKNIIVDFCTKHNLILDSGDYYCILFSGYDYYTTILIQGDEENGFYISDNAYPSFTYFWCDEVYANNNMGRYNITRAGWQEFPNPMSINGNITTNYEPIELLSITPFGRGLNPDINKNKIYRLFNRTEAGWKGTPIRNSGILNRVYHNKNLSVEEVEAIINTLDFEYTGEGHDGSEGYIYNVIDAYTQYFSYNYHIYKDGNKMYLYSGNYVWQNEAWRDAYGSKMGYDYVGWNAYDTDYDLGQEVYSVNWEGTETVGTQNDKLSAMLSETPFEYVEASSKLVGYYRVIDDEWKEVLSENNIVDIDKLPEVSNAMLDKIYRVVQRGGTTVPNTGYVEKVYFNTNMSDAEVEALIDKVRLNNKEGFYDLYIVGASSEEFIKDLGVYVNFYYDDNESESIGKCILYCVSYYDNVINDWVTDVEYVLWCNDVEAENHGITAGWQDFPNPIEINAEVLDRWDGDEEPTIGIYNNELNNLVSLTPITQNTEFTYHRVIDNKWEEVLGKNNIVDVKELPLLHYSVPTSGYIDKVYVNKKLTNEELVNIFENVLGENNGSFSAIVLANSNNTNIFINVEKYEGKWRIHNDLDHGLMDAYWTEDDGWILQSDAIEVASQNLVGVYSSSVDFKIYNDKLSEVFAIRPFGTKPEYELDKIYRIPEYKLTGGTEVPSSGLVEKVYFNTTLSAEEVNKILRNLEYVEGVLGFPALAIATTADMSSGIVIGNWSTGTYEAYSILTGSGECIYSFSNIPGEEAVIDGWQMNTYDLNIENMLSVLAPQVGMTIQNDKLKNLISSTPFEKELVGYKYHRVVDGKYVEVLSDSADKKVITIPFEEEQTLVLATEQLQLIKENKAILASIDPITNTLIEFSRTSYSENYAIYTGFIYLFLPSVITCTIDLNTGVLTSNSSGLLTQPLDFKPSPSSLMDYEVWSSGEPVGYLNMTNRVNELIDKKLATGGTGGGTSDFIDVDALPPINYAVPTSGYVEKIYLNKNLSIEEMVAIFERVIPEVDGKRAGDIWLDSNVYGLLEINYDSDSWQVVHFTPEITNSVIIWNQTQGWLVDSDEITLNANNEIKNIAIKEDVQYKLVGDKLADIFATKPFGTEPEYKLDKIYRVPENKIINGTAVPNSGTINNLYFNTTLDETQFREITNQLQWINASNLGQSGWEFYPVLAYMNGSYPYVLAFKKYLQDIDNHKTNDINMALVNFANMATITDFYISSVTGWQEFDNPYPINSSLLSELSGITLGYQNELLKMIISSTPFEKETTGYKYYRVVDGNWEEVLNENNPTHIIEKDYNSIKNNTLTFTTSEWEIIRNNPNVKLYCNQVIAGIGNMGALFEKTYYLKTSIAELVEFQSSSAELLSQEISLITVTVLKNNEGHTSKYSDINLTKLSSGGGLTESDVNQLIANYMTANYDNGDTEEF